MKIEILIKLAECLPEQKVVEMLDHAIQEYKRQPTPETFSSLCSFCIMTMNKQMLKERTASKIIDDMGSLHKLSNVILDPKN